MVTYDPHHQIEPPQDQGDLTMEFYTYKARGKPESVHDGDTLRLDIDLGFGNWALNRACRIYGIDTPEMQGTTKRERDLAIKARDMVRAFIVSGSELAIISVGIEGQGEEKYGRCLCKVYSFSGGSWVDIADTLIVNGLAKPYFGGKKEKW